MDNEERARKLFEEGASVAEVARQIGISAYKAKKLKPPEQGVPQAVGPVKADAEESLVWPIALEIPAADLDGIVEKIPAAEVHAAVMTLDGHDKANIVMIVLQARLENLKGQPL